MLRSALTHQMEMGVSEVVIGRQQMLDSVFPLSRRVAPSGKKVSMSEVFGVELRSKTTPAKTLTLISPQKMSTTAAAPSTPLTQDSVYKSLEQHFNAIDECQLCPLWTTRNKLVYGSGNPNARLLIIGEAPGAEEDRTGKPFVGRAGQLLDKILAAVELSRDEVYITNILKSRPPGNRDPQPDEVKSCLPYLHEQIRLIKPKLILALGRIAGQTLLHTNTPLGKLRSTWHDYHGVPLIVTYHPAALLRFPAYKKETWADMQMLKARYDTI